MKFANSGFTQKQTGISAEQWKEDNVTLALKSESQWETRLTLSFGFQTADQQVR